MQGQAHEGGVAAGQVILDGVVDEPDQLGVGVHQHRDEQVTLGGEKEVGGLWLTDPQPCSLHFWLLRTQTQGSSPPGPPPADLGSRPPDPPDSDPGV